ncbi:MAG: hypothetical protein HJJLKODD_00745 [Phycisphaerae bacterium]|nr:hypothetical protein [Phycisphaerae bacterium]
MSKRRSAAWIFGLFLLVSPVWCLADEPKINGRLETRDGARILTVWGSDYERGYAHGYLLAEGMVEFAGRALVEVQPMNSRVLYEERVVKGILKYMKFEPRYEQELQGLYDGLKTKVGQDGMMCVALQRPLTLDDLKAVNTLADWYAFFCSSFSAWGSLTPDGNVITARNLDFLKLPGVAEQQLIIVHLLDDPTRKKWVSVGWAGLIGCYTGMNENGLTLSVHDCFVKAKPEQPRQFIPRSFALRDAIETAGSEHPLDDVEKTLRACPTLFGNNIHVSCPSEGAEIPAAIFEYDGKLNDNQGVTRRTPEQNAADLPNNVLFCTNFHCLRQEPSPCFRFQALHDWLLQVSRSEQKITRESAWEIMGKIGNWSPHLFTTHTVYFLPNQREMWVSLAKSADEGAPNDQLIDLKLSDLLVKNP